MKRALLLILAGLVVPAGLMATPYVSPQEFERMPEAAQEHTLWDAPPSPMFATYDPLAKLLLGADFIATLQVDDTTSAAYGGMREGEHMLGIIQTDNTSESIWIWTRCYRRTGSDDYHENIDAAWEYCMNHRAYDEEGGDDEVTGYYRVYNCSWALRAEMEYRDVYGDTSFVAYAESCASYLCHHPMRLRRPTGMARRLNCSIMGWAVGNLYEYGVYVGNPVYTSKALIMADSLKDFAEAKPNCFHWDEWAMNGGAVMWGVVNSYFADNPVGLETWVETYAPYMDTEIDSSTYQNAWRGWSALGQFTATEALDSGTYGAYFQHLADTLVANDGDLDGGIPVIDPEPDDHDQTWVTNYLGFMCMDKMIDNAGLVARPELPAGDLLVKVTPMPSAEAPRLRFSLREPTAVKVDVYDIAGRSVLSRDQGLMEAGPHSVRLELGMEGAGAAGIYFYRIRAGRSIASGKIVVLR
jgi:hypothetical protein